MMRIAATGFDLLMVRESDSIVGYRRHYAMPGGASRSTFRKRAIAQHPKAQAAPMHQPARTSVG
jgi:hypothetical protein